MSLEDDPVDHEATDAANLVRRLWRHRGATVPSPRRGPRQRLHLDDILNQAIALADRDGLSAVSMRSLAGALGISPMALYAYVGTKDDLIALIQDLALGSPAERRDVGRDVVADAQEWATAFFCRLAEHPWLCEINWAESCGGPNERDWLEDLCCILDTGEVPRDSRAAMVTASYSLVRACAQTHAAQVRPDVQRRWRERNEATKDALPDVEARYPYTTALADPTRTYADAPAYAVREGMSLLLRGCRGVESGT